MGITREEIEELEAEMEKRFNKEWDPKKDMLQSIAFDLDLLPPPSGKELAWALDRFTDEQRKKKKHDS